MVNEKVDEGLMGNILIGKCSALSYKNEYGLDLERPLVSIDGTSDYYGHARSIKKYCGFSYDTQLRCNIQHAFANIVSKQVWDQELKFPTYLAQGFGRAQWVFENYHKCTFAIGPNIHYVDQLISEVEYQEESKRLGKNLLVFPLHATHHISVKYSIDDVIKKIDAVAADYDSVRICAYWRDIDSDNILEFEKRGYEITTAGHIYDPHFLHRLKHLITLSTHTCSIESFEGTQVPYAIFLNRPTFIIKLEEEPIVHGTTQLGEKAVDDMDVRTLFNEHDERVANTPLKELLTYPPVISQNLYGYYSEVVGFDRVRTPSEIKNILEIAQECQGILEYSIETIELIIEEYDKHGAFHKARLIEKEYAVKLKEYQREKLVAQLNEVSPESNVAGEKINMYLGHNEPVPKGWCSIDLSELCKVNYSISSQFRLPYDDGTVDFLYHSHILVRYSRSEAYCLMKECQRIMKPGGIIRVVVPDLEYAAIQYLEQLQSAKRGDAQGESRYEWSLIELIDQQVRTRTGGEMLECLKSTPPESRDYVVERFGKQASHFWGNNQVSKEVKKPEPSLEEEGDFRRMREIHKWGYDSFSLNKMFVDTGFTEMSIGDPTRSKIPQFTQYYLDIDENGNHRKPNSLIMEGVKAS
ncbi:MAG: hypothetical protein OCC49_12245 [Fibrobacterales bacterium]